MAATNVDSFSSEVTEKLKYYVYRLIDPRNGETFYAGKGKDNRAFAHAKGKVNSDEEELEPKLKRIWEIQGAGFEVAHVIHRHGMDEKTAIEVEAAVIDAYPGLTNMAGGAGSGDFGVMHSREIIARYRAEPAEFRHRAILINVNKTAGSHHVFVNPSINELINLQELSGETKPYQVRQFLRLVERYNLTLEKE